MIVDTIAYEFYQYIYRIGFIDIQQNTLFTPKVLSKCIAMYPSVALLALLGP